MSREKNQNLEYMRKQSEDMKATPQVTDLTKWWIFYNLDSILPGELEIDDIYNWTKDVMQNTERHKEIYAILFAELEEFRDLFIAPDSTV